MQNRQLIFSPKIPYDLVAERSEATASCLQFPVWWGWRDLNSHELSSQRPERGACPAPITN